MESEIFHYLNRKVMSQEIVGGKAVPRSSVGFGDPNHNYNYNGGDRPANPIPLWLQEIRTKMQEIFEQPFEHMLITHYFAKAGVGPHADNEKKMVKKSTVAAISLDSMRTLRITDGKGKVRLDLELEPGSVYSMEGDFQQFLKHSILPGDTARSSITFRHLVKDPPDGKKSVKRKPPASSTSIPKKSKKPTHKSRKKPETSVSGSQ
jgi:hypothetical protein